MKPILLTVLFGLFFFSLVFALNRQRDCKCRVPISARIIGGKCGTLERHHISDSEPQWQLTGSFGADKLTETFF